MSDLISVLTIDLRCIFNSIFVHVSSRYVGINFSKCYYICNTSGLVYIILAESVVRKYILLI